jgi:hypothetical protein
MRHFASALVLACMLSGTALAGEIPTSGAPAPQPTGSVITTAGTETFVGEVPSTGGETVLAVILMLISSIR